MNASLNRLLLAAGLALLASGCVIAPIGPRQPTYEEGPVVSTAPPPPQYEVVGVAPAVGMVWLAGYWAWAAGRYSWRPGYWAHPQPGHQWVPHAWIQGRGGWVYRPGHWRRG